MAQEYDYDVFISYSHRDEVWVVDTLLPRLDKAGLKFCVDFRDFKPGKPSLRNMREAVKRSRRTLLVLTPSWTASEWSAFEALRSRTSDPVGVVERTIPLLLQPCAIPEDVSDLTYVDFTRSDRADLAWRQLLTALGAAPEPPLVAQLTLDQWLLAHPYAMPPNFTGRVEERAMLSNWLTRDDAHPLLVLRALGGFGKSALTWHWLLHDVDPAQWPRVIWWSFYEADAAFDSLVAKAVRYLIGSASSSARDRVDALLRALRAPGTLLILDGFERALRAFGGLGAAYLGDEGIRREGNDRDCISPLAAHFLRGLVSLPDLRSKVLLTTRLRPAAVETRGGMLFAGCREEELLQLSPTDAVEFFHVQGIRGARSEIETVCAPYGYHPLSLCLLAGVVLADFHQRGDIAAARRLDVTGDLVQRQHHVLEQAYDSLPPARRILLSQIACFRGPVVHDAVAALGMEKAELDAGLRDLISRGLLQYDGRAKRFDLHPIVRRYAYDRLLAADRAAAHSQLRDHFAAVPTPALNRSLHDLAPVIELYHHIVRAGQYAEALRLYRDRLEDPIYYQFGAYYLQIDLLHALFPGGDADPPALPEREDQSWTANSMGNACALAGLPRDATRFFRMAIALASDAGHQSDVAISFANMATSQMRMGVLRGAEANLRHSIDICRDIENEFWEANGHALMGLLLGYLHSWEGSEAELTVARDIFAKRSRSQAEATVWTYRAICCLTRLRTAARSTPEIDAQLIAAIKRVVELARFAEIEGFSYVRLSIHALWLVGATHRMHGELIQAERLLHRALEDCRRIAMVDTEGDILIELARLRLAMNMLGEGERLADEAVTIADRCSYVLQGADAHLVLAEIARRRHDDGTARGHAAEALRLATCDGPPDYIYKAAYDEATAMLAALE